MESFANPSRPSLFSGSDWPFWKSRMKTFLEAQSYAIWQIVVRDFAIPARVAPGNVVDVENNSKAINILLSGLDRREHERVAHLDTAHKIWSTLITYHEGTSEIKTARQDIYKAEYNKFEQLPGESLEDMFGRFEVIVGKLRGVGVVYNDSEKARHILNSLDPIYEMRKIAIQESHKPAELTIDMLFSKIKTHKIDSEGRNPPRNRTLALVGSECQTAHGPSSVSESGSGPSSGFSLACLVSVSDEQLESFPEDDLALFVRRFSRAYKNLRESKGKHTKIFFDYLFLVRSFVCLRSCLRSHDVSRKYQIV